MSDGVSGKVAHRREGEARSRMWTVEGESIEG